MAIPQILVVFLGYLLTTTRVLFILPVFAKESNMDTKEFLEVLRAESHSLQAQIKALQAELEEVNRMIARRDGIQLSCVAEQTSEDRNHGDNDKPKSPLTMTPALHYLLDKFKGQPMSAMDYRDALLEMRGRGEFVTNIKDVNNVLPAVHQTLDAFAKRGFISTKKYAGKMKYFKPV
jgi:hypothetical protein